MIIKSIKIYFPKKCYSLNDNILLYGEVLQKKSCKIFYVTENNENESNCLIGQINSNKVETSNKWPLNYLNFKWDAINSHVRLMNIKVDNVINISFKNIYLILYTKVDFVNLSKHLETFEELNNDNDEIIYLSKLIGGTRPIVDDKNISCNTPPIKIIKLLLLPLKIAFRDTAVSHHLQDWWECVTSTKPLR